MSYIISSLFNDQKDNIIKYLIGKYPLDEKNFYEYGKLFYSAIALPENSAITFYFPLHKVMPTAFIYNLPEDTYPTSWSFEGSNNAKFWTNLVSSPSEMCTKENQIPINSEDGQLLKVYCKPMEKVFTFSNNKFFKYLRFRQSSNSCYNCAQHGYKNTIINYGLDVNGKITIDYSLFITDIDIYYQRFIQFFIINVLIIL